MEPFNFHGVRVGSEFRRMLAVICQAITFIFANAAKAEAEAESLRTHIEGMVKNRVREELRENNADDYKHQKARLRMKWDRAALKQLRDDYDLTKHAFGNTAFSSPIRSVRATIQFVMDELDKAYDLAPPLDDEKNEVKVEMPVIPAAPSADYAQLIDAGKELNKLPE